MAKSSTTLRLERPAKNARLSRPSRPSWARPRAGVMGMLLVAAVGLGLATRARAAESFNVTVLVKDAESEQPINQARLTLQFHEPGKIRHKLIAYSAKTNPQGRYRFTAIPKGTVRLIVTSEHHQTFSKEFDVDQNNQVIEVKLKQPQPLL